MKKLSTLALASALVGTLCVSALAPAAAYAESHGSNKHVEQNHKDHKRGPHRKARGGHKFLTMVCAPGGAAKAGERLDKMAKYLQLTTAQTETFNALKAAIKETRTSAAEACAPLKGAKPASPVEGMEKRQAIMQLQLDAMAQITPAFSDFYNSLDDGQKAKLNKKGMRDHGDHDKKDDSNA